MGQWKKRVLRKNVSPSLTGFMEQREEEEGSHTRESAQLQD
jgi:hypothetical protein